MAIEGIEKVVKADGFDFTFLKKVAKELNDSGALKAKVNVIGKKNDVVDRFMKGIESVPEGSKEEKKIPADAIQLYNSYADVMEDKAVAVFGPEKETPAKETPSKETPAAEGKKETPAKSASAVKQPGSINGQIRAMIADGLDGDDLFEKVFALIKESRPERAESWVKGRTKAKINYVKKAL